jgi:hypothetical protein
MVEANQPTLSLQVPKLLRLEVAQALLNALTI